MICFGCIQGDGGVVGGEGEVANRVGDGLEREACRGFLLVTDISQTPWHTFLLINKDLFLKVDEAWDTTSKHCKKSKSGKKQL